MLIKKSILVGAMAALIALPFAAKADLHTDNNTDEDSAVIVTSDSPFKGQCTGTMSGKFKTITYHRNHSDVNWTIVWGLCGAKTLCTANIYMTPDCSGNPTATGQLNTSTKIATITKNDSAKYNITASGANVALNYR